MERKQQKKKKKTKNCIDVLLLSLIISINIDKLRHATTNKGDKVIASILVFSVKWRNNVQSP